MSNAVYIDNCCTCGECPTLVETIGILRPTQATIDWINGGQSGPQPTSTETDLRTDIDTVWAELNAIDFDSPPLAFPNPSTDCGVSIIRAWGVDGGGAYYEPWFSYTPQIYSVLVTVSPYVLPQELPIGGTEVQYNPSSGGSLNAWVIFAFRTRIRGQTYDCVSRRSCFTQRGEDCNPPSAGFFCGQVFPSGGYLILPDVADGYDPQNLYINVPNSTSDPTTPSSFFDAAWQIRPSGTWILTTCQDCACP